jgi:SpoVK/Ycf46/Vps4 family AAA+-type ATPase
VIIDFQLVFLQNQDIMPVIGLDNLVSDDNRELANVFGRSNFPCSGNGCCGNDFVYPDYEVDEKDRAIFKNDKQHIFEPTEDLNEAQMILLPPHVYGFVLRTRRWAIFDIEKLELPDYGTGWDKLVVETDIKDTVLALVENHQRPREPPVHSNGVLPSVDLIQGKGRGLIILLHGEPGVGKTSTAECVAVHTKRPLFPITCGDIGDNAMDVERNLEKNFQLAHKWGCVLLLDEAE